jgi:uncharacterized membrane protein
MVHMAAERSGALGNGQDQSLTGSEGWTGGRWNASTGNAGNRKLNIALACLSVGLGVAALLRPRQIAKLMGLRSPDQVTYAAIRSVGIREIACGMGMLCQPRWHGWPRVRLVGDAIDLALLASALPLHRVQYQKPYSCAAATIAAVSALDAVATYAVEKQSASASRHGQDLAHVRAAITVNRSPDEAYELWRNFEKFPRFMANVESVRAVDERLSHWRATTGAEWDAEMVADRSGELIEWRSLEGAEVKSGRVTFRAAPGGRGTEISLELSYEPPVGAMGGVMGKLLGKDPGHDVRGDLRRMKSLLECGEVVRSDSTLEGASLMGRPAQPPVHVSTYHAVSS